MGNNATPSMGFAQAIRAAFSQYATFSGRAQRREYWYWQLLAFIVLIGTVSTAVLIGVKMDDILGTVICLLTLPVVLSLALFLPSLSVTVRRLHDIGKSGWWWLIGLIPVVGGIILLIWCCRKSQEGTNAYGESPKQLVVMSAAMMKAIAFGTAAVVAAVLYVSYVPIKRNMAKEATKSLLAILDNRLYADGIWYYIDGENAAVAHTDMFDELCGDIVIPQTISGIRRTYRVTSIRPEAFSNCKGITSVTIPISVTRIGEDAFDGCESLQRIIIPKGTRAHYAALLRNLQSKLVEK